MSNEFQLGGEQLNVNAFSGFDRPDDHQLVGILSSTSSDHDTIIQSGAVQSPLATLSGRTSDYEQVVNLRYWRNSRIPVDFVEPDEGTHRVVVLTLEVHKVSPMLFLWEWSATLVEIEAQSAGSGSGS